VAVALVIAVVSVCIVTSRCPATSMTNRVDCFPPGWPSTARETRRGHVPPSREPHVSATGFRDAVDGPLRGGDVRSKVRCHANVDALRRGDSEDDVHAGNRDLCSEFIDPHQRADSLHLTPTDISSKARCARTLRNAINE
jgi:hypothetical protein